MRRSEGAAAGAGAIAFVVGRAMFVDTADVVR